MKPMLAGKAPTDLAKLRYPLLAAPKIDGIRCLIVDGVPLTRSLKPIPNRFITETLRRYKLPALDGELLVGLAFSDCSSAVMSRDGEPEFTYWVFDRVDAPTMTFHARLLLARAAVERARRQHVRYVVHTEVCDEEGLLAYEATCLANGFEGVMLRDPVGRYKFGRSTTGEGLLLKLKRFEDAEAEIIGFEELLHNANEAMTGELGQTKRSKKQGGMVPMNTLGALVVKHLKTGIEFRLGTGFGAETRRQIWAERKRFLGSIVCFKSQPYGAKDAPRLPVFKGFRSVEDL